MLVSAQAFGWGATGHRVAARIGDNYLTAEARIAVEVILGSETLAEASTWPDFMRADPAEFPAWNTPNPIVWVAESADIRERIYPDDRDLRWDYGYKWTDTLYTRLQQAGVRTAA